MGIRDCDARCQGEEFPPNQGTPSTQDSHAHTHTPHKTTQQSRGGMMDSQRKTEGGASSEPACDVSHVCLRVRGLFGLTGELKAWWIRARSQIELGQGGARLERNDVTCGAITAVGVFL